MLSSLMDPVLQYLLYFAIVYGATVVVYFATGIGMTLINRRHPDRRIQKTRNGDKRMWVEIRSSLSALAVSAAMLSFGYFAQVRGWTIAPLETSWWSVAA